MNIYIDDVMQAVRQMFDLEPNDTSKDEEILQMDKREVFSLYCRWNGLIGCWDEYILDAVESIFNVSLDTEE